MAVGRVVVWPFMDLNQALGQFDTVEANLDRLDNVWKKARSLIPDGIEFMSGSPSATEYDNLRRTFGDILSGLPPIDGWQIEAVPLALDEIAQGRLDAGDVGEVSAVIFIEQAIYAPEEAIEEYRFRLGRARSKLVRARAAELVREIDRLVAGLQERVPVDGRPCDDDDWQMLEAAVVEIERLVGPAVRGVGRWNDLTRHLSFGQWCDLRDIAEHDWPSVRPRIESVLYSEQEPLPVDVTDLGAIVESRPSGKVSTALAWDRLDAESFERLIFNLINSAEWYQNAQWLTRTNASDRERDLSVERVQNDALSGVTRQRVIIQCKHWQTTSVSMPDTMKTVAAMDFWDRPPVDVLIIATSGRFTTDAVGWIEKHNCGDHRLQIEMWPESHLESLLAQRSALVVEFGLRDT